MAELVSKEAGKAHMNTLTLQWTDRVSCPNRPVYFDAAYQRLFAGHDGTTAKTIEITSGGKIWWLPLLLRDLGNGRSEAYSAYGYGGLFPVGSCLPEGFERTLRTFLASEGVICAFLRHTPFLGNQTLLAEDASEFNRRCYVRSLRPNFDLEQLCLDVDSKLRWSINLARRSGLAVRFLPGGVWPDADLQSFYSLYHALMTAKDTNPYYQFSEAFFRAHGEILGDRCDLALVETSDGIAVAGAFFLCDPGQGWAHYHLSASDRAQARMQPMEFLLASAMVRYANMGYSGFHLGGGHTMDATDGLSRFKRKFATGQAPFHISKWICDEVAYLEERSREPLPFPDFFLISAARGQG
jgi:hypothetical protein